MRTTVRLQLTNLFYLHQETGVKRSEVSVPPVSAGTNLPRCVQSLSKSRSEKRQDHYNYARVLKTSTGDLELDISKQEPTSLRMTIHLSKLYIRPDLIELRSKVGFVPRVVFHRNIWRKQWNSYFYLSHIIRLCACCSAPWEHQNCQQNYSTILLAYLIL